MSGYPRSSLAWGLKVSAAFRERLFAVAYALQVQPDYLMAAMAFESGETFSPSVKNAAGSGATGLIQFMPATAKRLGTTTAALAKLSAEEQLKWVELYFKPWRGRLHTLADVYMAILWPAAIGKPESMVLWDALLAPTAYRQNAGLDTNKDGVITKAEAAAKVQAKLVKGMRANLLWRG